VLTAIIATAVSLLTIVFYRLIRVDPKIRKSTAALASIILTAISPILLVLIIIQAVKTIKKTIQDNNRATPFR